MQFWRMTANGEAMGIMGRNPSANFRVRPSHLQHRQLRVPPVRLPKAPPVRQLKAPPVRQLKAPPVRQLKAPPVRRATLTSRCRHPPKAARRAV